MDEVTNTSGIEGLNYTKKEGTFRERLSLMAFMDVMFNLVKSWSQNRDPASPNCCHFVTEFVDIPTKLWTDAYN